MENRTGKYLKYATGEIVLVVIGILIALQINTWNESRKNRVYELTMLKDVKDALEADSAKLMDRVPYLEGVMASIHEIAVMKNDPSLSTDSLELHLQELLNYGTFIAFNKSPFKALESGGLDRVSNAEIRKNISTLYGFTLANAEIWINEVLRHELLKKTDMFSEMFGLKVTPAKDNSIETKLILKNPSIIYDNPEFDRLLFKSSWPLPLTIKYLNTLNEQMILLIDQIDQELKKG